MIQRGATPEATVDRILHVVEALAHELRPRRAPQAVTQETGAGLDARSITHAELLDLASTIAGSLQAQDLKPRHTVALMLPTGLDYFVAFFGEMLAGGVPVPLYPPLRASQLEDHLRRLAGILSNSQARMLIARLAALAAVWSSYSAAPIRLPPQSRS